MGQTLSEPVRDKQTSSNGDRRLIYALSEMQGWRISILLVIRRFGANEFVTVVPYEIYKTTIQCSACSSMSILSLTTNYHA